MATWDALDNEYTTDIDKGEEILALMTLTSSDTKSECDSGLESEDEDELFSNLSHSDHITVILDLMSHYKDKARHVKILNRDHDFFKEELKMSQDKFQSLENDHNALLNNDFDKNIEYA